MRENMYNLGYSIAMTVPIAIALFCIMKIRKNKNEIKRLEDELKAQEKTHKKSDIENNPDDDLI